MSKIYMAIALCAFDPVRETVSEQEQVLCENAGAGEDGCCGDAAKGH